MSDPQIRCTGFLEMTSVYRNKEQTKTENDKAQDLPQARYHSYSLWTERFIFVIRIYI